MKKLFFAVVSLLLGTFCYAQELTKDGFGPLHWGMSVAEAKKLLPDFEETKSEGKGGVMLAKGVLSNLFLDRHKERSFVRCFFYDGKFIAVRTESFSKEFPGDIFYVALTKGFEEDLKQQIVKKLGSTDELNVDILVGGFNLPNARMPFSRGNERSAQGVSENPSLKIVIVLSSKKLVQTAMEDSEKRLREQVEKVKEELLTSIPSALNP